MKSPTILFYFLTCYTFLFFSKATELKQVSPITSKAKGGIEELKYRAYSAYKATVKSITSSCCSSEILNMFSKKDKNLIEGKELDPLLVAGYMRMCTKRYTLCPIIRIILGYFTGGFQFLKRLPTECKSSSLDPTKSITRLVMDSKGKRLVWTTLESKDIVIYDIKKSQVIKKLPFPIDHDHSHEKHYIYNIAFCSNDHYLVGISNTQCCIYNAREKYQLIDSVKASEYGSPPFRDAACSTYNNELFILTCAGNVFTYNIEESKYTNFPISRDVDMLGHERYHSLAFSPDGKKLAFCKRNYGQAALYDTTMYSSGMLEAGVSNWFENNEYSRSRVVFSSDSRKFFVLFSTGFLHVYNVYTPSSIIYIEDDKIKHNDSHDIAMSTDGKLFALGGKDVLIYDSESYELVQTIKNCYARSLIFSPDRARLICGLSDGTVAIWKIFADMMKE